MESINTQRSSQDASEDVSALSSQAGRVIPQGYLLGVLQRSFLLVSLYVLSIGPMYWHWYDGKFVTGSPIIAAFYEPLVIAATYIPPFGEWLDWYVDLWIS